MTWVAGVVVAFDAVLGPLMVLAGYSFYRLNRWPSGCRGKLGPEGVVVLAWMVSLVGVGALVQAALMVLPMATT